MQRTSGTTVLQRYIAVILIVDENILTYHSLHPVFFLQISFPHYIRIIFRIKVASKWMCKTSLEKYWIYWGINFQNNGPKEILVNQKITHFNDSLPNFYNFCQIIDLFAPFFLYPSRILFPKWAIKPLWLEECQFLAITFKSCLSLMIIHLYRLVNLCV